MANRRMISKDIILSYRFQRMSLGAKLLYFYILLCADDDGVVSLFTVRRLCIESTDADVEVLLRHEFIRWLIEDELVIVAVDFNVHNSIQPSRYSMGIYYGALSARYADLARTDVLQLEKNQKKLLEQSKTVWNELSQRFETLPSG